MTQSAVFDPQAIFLQALHAHQTGRLQEAERLYGQVLRHQAGHADALHLSGVLAIQRGDAAGAVALIGQAIAAKPESPAFHANLATALRQLGRLAEAADSYRQALRLKSDYVEALNNLGTTLRDLGDLAEAERYLRRAARVRPDFADAHNNLGNLLRETNRRDEAEACFRRALALTPIGHAKAVQINNNLGTTLRDLGRLDEAEAAYRRALQIDGKDADANNNLGAVLRDRGRLDDARELRQRALLLAPDRAIFHYDLAMTKRFQPGDPQIATMERLLERGEALAADDRIYLHFALGKAYEDIGDGAAAWRHLRQANPLKRRLIRYDEAESLQLFDRIVAGGWSELPAPKAPTGPIFILGMPRSGSSLVEQILASHPQLFGAGEVSLFRKAIDARIGRPAFPEGLAALAPEDFAGIGQTYLTAMARRVPEAEGRRISDKLPHNFLYCGAIAQALPTARIIHTVRDPVDTCLSCYSKLFVGRHAYAYELGELGRYYAAYRRLMAHWRRSLPEGVMLDLDYEALVNDPEGQIRRLLEFCGLPWDAACLDFHKTERSVRTASALQVRQPVYNSSVGRWRPPAGQLQPLLDGLEAP